MPWACRARGTAMIQDIAYDNTKYVVKACRVSQVAPGTAQFTLPAL